MNNEEKILLLLERIQEDVGGLKQGQTRIEKDIVNIKEDVVNIKEDILDVKEDIVNIKDDIVNIKGDILDVKEDIVNIKDDIVNIKEDIVNIKEDIEIINEEAEATRAASNYLLKWRENAELPQNKSQQILERKFNELDEKAVDLQIFVKTLK